MSNSSLLEDQNATSFTQEEDFNILRYAYDNEKNFDKIVKVLGNKHTQKEYKQRFDELVKIPKIAGWTEAENVKLKEYVKMFGVSRWRDVAALLPGRNSKQCRDHYINQLAPDIVKGKWTAEEDRKILESSKIYGTSWTKIRTAVPNRSELDIKNRYNKLIRELIDKGTIHDIDEIMEGVLNNPKVKKNTKEASEGYKTLNLKLEITPDMLKMQEKMKKSQSSMSEPPPELPTSIPKASNIPSYGTIIKPEDFIRKVDVSPYENVLIPGKTSDVAQVLVEEAERHQKLQKYSLNPYDIFKIKNINRMFYQPMCTKKYSHLPDDVRNSLFGSNEIPIPNDITTTTTATTTNPNSSSDLMTDPLLPLFPSSTATSSTSSSSSSHNITKRRRQIETNPYIIDWYCPSCGNKNEAGLLECKFNNCNYVNPFIDKYEKQIHIQRVEYQSQRENEDKRMLQRKVDQLQMELKQLKEEEKLSKQNYKRSKINPKIKKPPLPRKVYHTRQAGSDFEDEEEGIISDNNSRKNQNFIQQQPPPPFQQKQENNKYFDDNEMSNNNSSDDNNIIPFPYHLLEQNVNKEDGSLKPWYCPICSNKNDMLQDECTACHADNPNSYVNVNGKIVKKFTLSNIEIPVMYMPQQTPPPPAPPPPLEPLPLPSQQIHEDNIMNWICYNCGSENDNSMNVCINCNKPKLSESVLIQDIEDSNSSSNSWTCINCHFKNKSKDYVCKNCNNERSFALQPVDDDDDDDDDDEFYGFNDNIMNEGTFQTIQSTTTTRKTPSPATTINTNPNADMEESDPMDSVSHNAEGMKM